MPRTKKKPAARAKAIKRLKATARASTVKGGTTFSFEPGGTSFVIVKNFGRRTIAQ
jgi:hypothetical protein